MTTQVTMDPGKLTSGERKIPFMQGRLEGKCIHGNDKGMGCCGYDELAVKPATTTPFTFGTRARAQAKKEEIEMGERPRIQAKPMPSADLQVPGLQSIPLQPGIGGRVPDGNLGVGAQVRSIFDIPKLQKPQWTAPQRPRVVAKALGQEAPPVPAPAPLKPPSSDKVEAVLKREAPPEGLVKKEAEELAVALTPALENSRLALAEGEHCIGIDDSSLKKATGLRDGLAKFANQAPENARLEVDPADITLMEQVLECSSLYEARKQAATSKTVAFIAGGLLVGALAFLLSRGS